MGDIFTILIILSPLLLIVLIKYIYQIVLEDKIRELADDAIEMTPSEFMKLRKANKYYALSKNYEGVYILYNKTRNMYYVGQSVHVLNRIAVHFTGRGNGDVYADYKYGDEFTIRTIALEGSGFKTLNELERNTISTYKAFSKGYNKTRGNRG